MKAHDEAMYWMKNKDWYKANYEEDRFELTSVAPPRAVESFKMYLLRNDIRIDESIIPKMVPGTIN